MVTGRCCRRQKCRPRQFLAGCARRRPTAAPEDAGSIPATSTHSFVLFSQVTVQSSRTDPATDTDLTRDASCWSPRALELGRWGPGETPAALDQVGKLLTATPPICAREANRPGGAQEVVADVPGAPPAPRGRRRPQSTTDEQLSGLSLGSAGTRWRSLYAAGYRCHPLVIHSDQGVCRDRSPRWSP